jgi:uridine kinase
MHSAMNIDDLAREPSERIVREVLKLGSSRAYLVAISGIDGSGKGTFAEALDRALRVSGIRTAVIGLDAWHQPKSIRFSDHDPGGHFYARAFRFDALFSTLVDPLRARRSMETMETLLDLATDRTYDHRFDLRDVDVILLEGILLFKRELRDRYDLSIWIECGFDVALERALRRNQENQSREELIRDYDLIYFAAQRIHLERDDPRAFVDIVVDNS